MVNIEKEIEKVNGRELKFRAWDKHIGEMTYCDPLHIGDYLCDPDNVIMQYTGLRDRNGREIYEGDIYQIWSDYGDGGYLGGGNPWEPRRDVVTWKSQYTGSGFHSGFGHSLANRIEVVGNIYEHSHLLDKNS